MAIFCPAWSKGSIRTSATSEHGASSTGPAPNARWVEQAAVRSWLNANEPMPLGQGSHGQNSTPQLPTQKPHGEATLHQLMACQHEGSAKRLARSLEKSGAGTVPSEIGRNGHRPAAGGDSPAAGGVPSTPRWVRSPARPKLGGKSLLRTVKLAGLLGFICIVPAKSAFPTARKASPGGARVRRKPLQTAPWPARLRRRRRRSGPSEGGLLA